MYLRAISWDRWTHLDERTPVIVGVGVASQRVDDPGEGVGALALMLEATRRAGDDCGTPDLLAGAGLVSIPEGSWSYADPGGYIAAEIGAPTARTVILKAGIPQQTLFDEAYRAVVDGTHDVVVIVGGEAARRAALARRAGVEPADGLDGAGEPDERREPEGEIVSALELQAGLWTPVQQYALIDSALRFAEGRSVAEHRDDIAALCAGYSRVASGFEHAEHRDALPAAVIREPGPGNRAMSFPYNKWHCSQMHVDQAAAVLVTSLGTARAAGADPSRVVFPLVALESSAAVPVIRRRDLHRWPAMRVLGEAAAEHLGAPLHAIGHVEVYSCFPAAVRVQQRELGLPLDDVPTITGGEPFAGGPWNNFVLQATAAMVDRLRTDRGSLGMVTTVSGFLTKPGLAVYSTEPGTRPVLVADLATDAAGATPVVPVAVDHRGPATIAACTVSFERDGDRRVIALVDTPAGERWLTFSHDPAVAERAMDEELIGTDIQVDGFEFRIERAHRSAS